jgi:hypothetical protein
MCGYAAKAKDIFGGRLANLRLKIKNERFVLLQVKLGEEIFQVIIIPNP